MDKREYLRQNAQKLRKTMTKEERHLWYDFLKTYPVQIRRQYVIDHYIVDFYCHQARLAIELDGGQHCTPESTAYDEKRTEFLESRGIYVLRLSNLDVMRQFRPVCEVIDRTIQARIHLL